VAPHRWADAWAGRLGAAERAAMAQHADACARCARARDRVKRASDSFPSLRAQPSPELPWDSVRAGVHWAVSKARRTPPSPRSRLAWLAPRLALGALGAGAAAVALATGPVQLEPPAAPVASAPLAGSSAATSGSAAAAAAFAASASASAVPGAPGPDRSAPPLVGLVNRATGDVRDVMIDGLRRGDLFARTHGPGAVLATSDGRVDVQFAEGGALALGPRSRLQLRRFDADSIELAVDGTVDIEVSPRAPHQRFVVLAGDRAIEVRGTRFRVRHDAGAVAVACSHGLVAVRDRAGQVEIPAARRLELPAAAPVAGAAVSPLSAEELDELAATAPLRLAAWSSDALLRGSAPLSIEGGGRREVRVDGVELGVAPLSVRALPGRHTVEIADAAGRFRRAGWVDVAAAAAGAAAARFELPAELPPARDVAERRRQLRAGLDPARLRECTRRMAKQGVLGTYVQIELRVDASGAVNFLNVIDTDLGSVTAGCVRNAIADVRFAPGPAATWRERIDL
jgi:hypothetical protein